jgi:hypothetical protein
MARRHDAGRYLLEGLTPQQIELRMGISLSSVRQYLCTLVGEGVLRHSDIAFNIAERHLIEGAICSNNSTQVTDGPYKNLQMAQQIYVTLAKQGHKVSRDLVELYLITRDARPDLYALICEIEVGLSSHPKEKSSQLVVLPWSPRWPTGGASFAAERR